jgi:hypothetical protein
MHLNPSGVIRPIEAPAPGVIAVYLEVGQKRVFACALAWPGWCRSGKTEEQALDALLASAGRYAMVAQEAGVPFPLPRRDHVGIVERLPGLAGYTDFGAPGVIASGDHAPLTVQEMERHLALLQASWTIFDRVVAAAPAELRKGPRGGGRDRAAMVDHVLAAEVAYARKLGVKQRRPGRDDSPAISALRTAIVAAVRAQSPDGPAIQTAWPPRYAMRRIAWHVLDHAWEMEDRGTLEC